MITALKTRQALLVIVVALVTALITAKFLSQGTGVVALPWGVLAFLCAFIASSKKVALTLGGCFGFVVSYSYLWFDNTDHLTFAKVTFLTVLIILPAIFGLLCGTLAAWLGWVARKRLFHL